MNVQIIGLFNSGTNLMAKIIKHLFDCHIHIEGHTIFWKHSFVTKDFLIHSHQKNNSSTHFVVVIKHIECWKESMKKRMYTLEEDEHGSVTLHPPQMNVANCNDSVVFKSYNDCWNQYYTSAISNIPGNRVSIIRYEDILFHPKKVIEKLSKKIKLKDKYRTKPYTSELNQIMQKPAKKTGNSKYGNEAKKYYFSRLKEVDNTNVCEELKKFY